MQFDNSFKILEESNAAMADERAKSKVVSDEEEDPEASGSEKDASGSEADEINLKEVASESLHDGKFQDGTRNSDSETSPAPSAQNIPTSNEVIEEATEEPLVIEEDTTAEPPQDIQTPEVPEPQAIKSSQEVRENGGDREAEKSPELEMSRTSSNVKSPPESTSPIKSYKSSSTSSGISRRRSKKGSSRSSASKLASAVGRKLIGGKKTPVSKKSVKIEPIQSPPQRNDPTRSKSGSFVGTPQQQQQQRTRSTSKMHASQASLSLSRKSASGVGDYQEPTEMDLLIQKYGLNKGVDDFEGDEEDLFNQTNLPGVSAYRKKSIRRRKDVSSDAESSPVSESEEFERPSSPEYPAEYWQVQRLIKYIKAGNPTATIIAMSALRDYNLKDHYIQMSIRDTQGLEVLLNILETEENRCKIASLLVLKEISSNPDISRNIFNMKGLETLVDTLNDPAKELKLLAAETISNVTKIRKARRAMRKGDGIYRLVDMLQVNLPNQRFGIHNNDIWSNVDFELARSGAMALWSIAKSTKNKDAIRRAGAIPLLAKLLQSKHIAVVIPVVGVLHECASEPSFRLAIRTEGLLEEFVHGLRSPNHQLVQFSASAIHMCAEDPISRQKLYEFGVVDPLIYIIQDPVLRGDKPLLAATTGALWKCSASIAKDRNYLRLSLIELFVSLLHDEPENILSNIAGAIDQILKSDPANCQMIMQAGAIPPLVDLLTINNPALLVNATQAVGELARDPETRNEMDVYDGFRLLWALLKHPSPQVQASAAWAICPYVESTLESGDIIRNFVGGLETLVQLLGSDDPKVQSAVCQAVAVIATNQDNLAIMSDHGVVKYLARLAPTMNDELRKSVAAAIAECCKWKKNASEFGRRNTVSPICCYLNSEDPLVHRSAAKALHGLSADAKNCIVMHQCGVVPHLINMVGSSDYELQEGAAGALYNIRKLSLNVEKVRLR